MVGAFPPPIHGMSVVNNTIRERFSAKGIYPIVINLSATSLNRKFVSRFSRLSCVIHGILRFGYLLSCRTLQSLYISISGGFGQIYEMVFLILARLFGLRIFIHHHSYAYLDSLNRTTYLLLRIAGVRTTHVALSIDMAKKLRMVYPNIRDVMVISNAAMIEQNNQELLRNNQTIKKIGYIGNISREKGIIDFLNVADKLESQDLELKSLIAGPFQDPIIELTVKKRLHLLRNTEYTGPKYGSDKIKFFKEIDVLLFPTQYVNEAEPLIILEAMQHGTPVISFDRGSIAEIIPKNSGLVVNNDENFVDAAVKQLKFWQTHPNNFLDASKNAKKRFLKLKSIYDKRFEILYERILAN